MVERRILEREVGGSILTQVAVLYPSSEVMQSGLCRTWSENPKPDAAYIMSNNHCLLFKGDTSGHTMFSIIPPI